VPALCGGDKLSASRRHYTPTVGVLDACHPVTLFHTPHSPYYTYEIHVYSAYTYELCVGLSDIVPWLIGI